jgi:hypothetical protein
MTSDLNLQFLTQIISTQKVLRNETLEVKLIQLGLEFQISPGVVLNEVDFHSEFLHSAFLSKLLCQRNLTIGEVGCALAHRNAITNFLKSNCKFGLIFEDDAEVIGEFNFDVMIKLLESKTPIAIALGWSPGFAIAKSPLVPMNGEPIELITSPTGAFAYALNRPAAELIRGAHEKIIDLPDWPIFTLNKLNFYSTCLPWVTANHNPDFSIIGVRSTPTSKNPFKKLARRIRLVLSLITLVTLSKTGKLQVSTKQIAHRILIRDLLYKYGKSQVNENSIKNEVIPFPLKFQRLLNLLKIN